MIVIGIDPGYANLGFAAICTETREVVLWRTITTKPGPPSSERVRRLRDQLEASYAEVVAIAGPVGLVAVEMANGLSSYSGSLKLGMAQATAVLSATGIPLRQLTPHQVRAGIGSGSKLSTVEWARANYSGKLAGLLDSSNRQHAIDAVAIADVGYRLHILALTTPSK